MLTNFSAVERVLPSPSSRDVARADDHGDAQRRDSRFRDQLSETQARVASQKLAQVRAHKSESAREQSAARSEDVAAAPSQVPGDKASVLKENRAAADADNPESSNSEQGGLAFANEPAGASESESLRGNIDPEFTAEKVALDEDHLDEEWVPIIATAPSVIAPQPDVAVSVSGALNLQQTALQASVNAADASVASAAQKTELARTSLSLNAVDGKGLAGGLAVSESMDEIASAMTLLATGKSAEAMTGTGGLQLGGADRLMSVSAEGVAKDFANLMALANGGKTAAGGDAGLTQAMSDALAQSVGGEALAEDAGEPLPQLLGQTASATQALSARPTTGTLAFNQAFGQQGWSNEVGEKVLWMAAQNLKSAEIRLDPPELGTLQVRVSLQQDQVQVSFTSAQPAVREALDNQASRLREMIAEQGLNLVDVNVSDRHPREQAAQDHADVDSSAESDGSDAVLVGQTTITSSHLVDQYV